MQQSEPTAQFASIDGLIAALADIADKSRRRFDAGDFAGAEELLVKFDELWAMRPLFESYCPLLTDRTLSG